MSKMNLSLMTNTDYKKTLRKLDYMQCCKDVLFRVETLCNSKKNLDHCMEIIAEYIFVEKRHSDSRKSYNARNQPSSLSVFQEFQLVLVMTEFFSRPGPDITRNAVFLLLFGGSTLSSGRSRVLWKFISTAITDSSASVLCAAGTWMQQLGPNGASCLELAQRLVEDFIIYPKACCEQLKSLPMVAPRFAVNFMTSVSGLYLTDGAQMTTPPEQLIEVFTEWITDNPALCSAQQPALALLPGAIPMALVPPIDGLIRWCVLAPLFQDKIDTSYSRLHLAILQGLIQSTQGDDPPTPMNAHSLQSVIEAIKNNAEIIRKKTPDLENDERLQICLDRFAQAVQLALTSKIIAGSIPQLLCRLETLPQNTLLKIVINTQKPKYL